MDVFLVGVAAEDEFQFRRGDEFADDMENVVSDDAFGGGEIAYPHADDPTLGIAQFVALPLLDVLLHRDIFRLPVVRLHRAVKLVGPLILQRKQVEGFCLAAVDDALGGVGFFGFFLIEDEGAVSDSEFLFHGACGCVEGSGRNGFSNFCESLDFSDFVTSQRALRLQKTMKTSNSGGLQEFGKSTISCWLDFKMHKM